MATLSIIVPVYNEEHTLTQVMTTLAKYCPEAQMIYVDDGSSDQSLYILQANARSSDIVLTKKNGGKGSAIRMGLSHATKDFTVIQDADLEYDPSQLSALLQRAEQDGGKSGIFGSRFLIRNPCIYWRFLLGNKIMTTVLNLLFGCKLTDSYTCYKLLPTAIFRSLPLTARGFELEAEICALCMIRNIPIIELPIRYQPRTIDEGKKIRWSDGWKGILTLLKIRCTSLSLYQS